MNNTPGIRQLDYKLSDTAGGLYRHNPYEDAQYHHDDAAADGFF